MRRVCAGDGRFARAAGGEHEKTLLARDLNSIYTHSALMANSFSPHIEGVSSSSLLVGRLATGLGVRHPAVAQRVRAATAARRSQVKGRPPCHRMRSRERPDTELDTVANRTAAPSSNVDALAWSSGGLSKAGADRKARKSLAVDAQTDTLTAVRLSAPQPRSFCYR